MNSDLKTPQVGIIISNPLQQAKHYSIVEVRGLIANISSEEITIYSHSYSANGGKIGANIPNYLPAHHSTDDIVLLTIEFNKHDIDPIENMFVGHIALSYRNTSGQTGATPPALFQIFLVD